MLHQYRDGEPSSFGIVLKETGTLIGTIGFMSWDAGNGSLEVGYSLSRSYWGKGLMTEALSAVLSFAFTDMKVHRVWAVHETSNPASGRVMQKCGMQFEGIERGAVWNKGRYTDVARYAVLVNDPRPALNYSHDGSKKAP